MNEATSDPTVPPDAAASGRATASPTAQATFRPWRAAVGAALALAAVAVLVACLKREPVFVASALIMIEESPPYVVFSEGSATAGSMRYVETQIELIRSPLVLEVLLTDAKIANFPAVAASQDRLAHLQDHLSISRINVSELYNVSYSSSSPQHAALVANSIVNEYLKIQERSAYERYQRVADLLEDERLHRSTVVEELRRRVVNLSKEVTGKDPFGEGAILDAQALNNSVDDALMQLREVEIASEVLKAEVAYQRGHPGQSADEAPTADGPPTGADDLVVDQSPAVAAWCEAIAATRAALAEIREADADWSGSPHFARLTEQVDAQQTSLDELIKNEPTSPPRESSAPPAGDVRSLAALEQEARALEVKRELLTKLLKEQVQERQAGNSSLVDLQFARAELERQDAVLEMIEGRKLAMQTESRAPPRVNVRQRAAIPSLPQSPGPYERPAMLTLSAVLAAAGVALLATSRKAASA